MNKPRIKRCSHGRTLTKNRTSTRKDLLTSTLSLCLSRSALLLMIIVLVSLVHEIVFAPGGFGFGVGGVQWLGLGLGLGSFHVEAAAFTTRLERVGVGAGVGAGVGMGVGVPTALPLSIRNNHGHKHKHEHEQHVQPLASIPTPTSRPSRTALGAITKRKTAIFDGAEFVSIASTLKQLYNDNDNHDDNHNATSSSAFWSMPSQKTGYMTFITSKNDKNQRIIAIEKNPQQETQTETIQLHSKDADATSTKIQVYKDSITNIPNSISDNDAISTAVSALSGVYCALVNTNTTISCVTAHSNAEIDSTTATNNDNKESKTIVVLGGSDFACFIAKALDVLIHGAATATATATATSKKGVSLITTRPMSLKDTPLNPLRGTNINVMPPVSGDDELGFSDVIGQFDAVVDTIADEANLANVMSLNVGVARVFGQKGVSSKLKSENKCDRYISTLTQSQSIVLEEGILFARDPVLKYQEKLEKQEPSTTDPSDDDNYNDNDTQQKMMCLPPPPNYNQILQTLFDSKTIFPTDRNENGSHASKKVFVRGCSFPDYAEIEIWPVDSIDGAAVRYGFPGIGELTLEAKTDALMGVVVDDDNANGDASDDDNTIGSTKNTSRTKTNKTTKKKKKQDNPFVMKIDSLKDISTEIRNEKKNAVLYVNAPYCKLCRNINPLYTRMARISKEEKKSDTLFSKASSAGKEGKQLTFTLQIESVPTFVLFREGERYGEPFGVTRLPSKKLEKAIEYMETGKDWDPEIVKEDSNKQKNRTKLK